MTSEITVNRISHVIYIYGGYECICEMKRRDDQRIARVRKIASERKLTMSTTRNEVLERDSQRLRDIMPTVTLHSVKNDHQFHWTRSMRL